MKHTYLRLNGILFPAGLLIISVFILSFLPARGDVTVSQGNCPGVAVRKTISFRNDRGVNANDFHFRLYEDDGGNTRATGGQVGVTGAFTGGTMTPTADGDPSGTQHGVDVDLNGGVVPPGGIIRLKLVLCLNEENCIKMKNINWTFNGVVLGRAGENQGFRARNPQGGGNGGAPNPNGGGHGGQEGGGGTGNYIHRFYIENDDTMDIHILNLQLLASMNYYVDLDSINWAGTAPIADPGNPYPITIHPGSRYTYYLNTTGPYVGGHIYTKYTVASDTTIVFGDHPVTAISTDPLPDNVLLPNNLFPPNGPYMSAPGALTTFPNGVVIKNIVHNSFTNFSTPPALYSTSNFTFGSQVSMEVSINGGFTFFPVTAPASTAISSIHDWNNGNTSNYQCEMTSLNISGGTLPPGVMIRESPTLPSMGRTSATPGTGNFQVESFFDVFIELSFDGGQTWTPANNSTQVQLHSPNPIPTLSQWGLILFSLLLLITGVMYVNKNQSIRMT